MKYFMFVTLTIPLSGCVQKPPVQDCNGNIIVVNYGTNTLIIKDDNGQAIPCKTLK